MAEMANLLVAPQHNKVEGSTAEIATANTNDLIGNNSVVDPPSVSLGSSYHGENSGGSSPVKISTPKSKQKVIPNYLRRTRGSCHDLCKYGRRLTDEPIHWRSLPKRNGKPPIEIFVSKKPPVSAERKKVTLMKPMRRDINLSPDHVMVSEEPTEITLSKKVEFSPKRSETGKRMSEIVRKSPRHNGAEDVKIAVRSKSATSVDASEDIRRNLKLVPCTKDQSSRQKAQRSEPNNEEISNHVDDKKKDVEEKNNNDATRKNGKDIAKVNPAITQRKGIAVTLKDRDSSLPKMKFQRGRTVELQSASSGARKLKFKRSKSLVVNQDRKADVTKNFRKAAVIKARVNPKSRNVLLRHRSMVDKKDVQGLFNNVIEETASKLVQSRKSKVKALVGAFETVISLQDAKQSSNVVTA